MLIVIKGSNCKTLRSSIIDDALSEKLPTWGVVNTAQGDKLLTHTPEQWNERVLLVLSADTDSEIVVTASYWKNHEVPSLDDISFYFGRFVEILLAHYRDRISSIEITV